MQNIPTPVPPGLTGAWNLPMPGRLTRGLSRGLSNAAVRLAGVRGIVVRMERDQSQEVAVSERHRPDSLTQAQ